MYANHPHRPQNRPVYQDEEEDYYSPPAYQRPQLQQTPSPGPPPPRRRPNPVPQDATYPHYYHRHRDERDSWPSPGPPPDMIPPQQPRRPPSVATNSTSDYNVRPRSRAGRSNSTARGVRSKSSSPRRHAASLSTAAPISQPSVSEREALVRQRLRATFETYVFNTLPTHLLRITDMALLTRNEIWDTFKPRIESLSDSHLARLLLEQDEEARKMGVSVLDPEVTAPFTEYIRSMISFGLFSHKRGNSESLFQELAGRRFQVTKRPAPTGSEYQKLVRFCEKARNDYGCEYVWADTCCINKESGADVEEVTLSMARWCSEAQICIVYLAESSSLEDLVSDPWFTSSWTLQELLFARKIRFYGRDWSPIIPMVAEGRREERNGRENREEQRINDRDIESVVAALTKATGIPEADIRNFVPGCTRVSEKMRWASQRTACRIEDMAYSLLALFDVTIPIAYGEGARAFHKLMMTIADQYTEPDLFAWTGKPSQWSLALPSSPQCYAPQALQGDVSPSSTLGDPTYELTKLGLRIRLVLIPTYCEPLDPTDAHNARFLLTPALPIAQDPIQVYVPLSSTVPATHAHASRGYEYEHDLRDPQMHVGVGRGREREPRGYEYEHDLRDPQMHVGVGRGREREPRGYEYEHDLRDPQMHVGVGRGREREREREREYVLGVVDYDARAGRPGSAALHAGWAHLCLVLERERRGRGWLRVARPGALHVWFRESELFPVESVCVLHRA